MIKDKIKIIFANKFNILLISVVFIFTVYYAGFIASKLSGIRSFYNDSDNGSFIDISSPKTFSLKVNTDNLTAIQFPFIINSESDDNRLTDKELDELKFDIKIASEKEIRFSTDVLSNGDNEHFLKIFLAPKIENKKNKSIDITIQSDEGISFLLNDSGNVIYKLNGLKKIIIFGVVIFFILFIVLCLLIIYKTRKWNLENRFLLFAFLLGFAYLFIRAPCTQSDELVHYDTAYNMSNIMLGYENSCGQGTLLKRFCDTDLLPGYDTEVFRKSTTWVANGGRNYYKHVFSNLKRPCDSEIISYPSNKSLAPQRAYIFSALAVSACRLLNFNQFVTYYSGCIINLIISILLIYFGIRINKKYQYIFATFSLFPAAIITFGSYSYDAMLFSFSYFIINLILYLYDTHEFNYKLFMIIIFASLFQYTIKVVYFMIPLLLVLLFFYSKNLKKRIYISIVIVIAGYLLIYILAKCNIVSFFNSRFINEMDISNTTNKYTYSVKDVVIHPISFISLVVSKIVEQSWIKLHFTPIFIPSFMKILFITSIILLFFKNKEQKNDISIAISCSIVCIVIFLLLCLVGIYWTTYGEYSLWGIEPRYFIPVIPLFLIAFRNTNICNIRVNENVSFHLTVILSFFYLINLFLQTIFWVGISE